MVCQNGSSGGTIRLPDYREMRKKLAAKAGSHFLANDEIRFYLQILPLSQM
jgi:hypothetical protein